MITRKKFNSKTHKSHFPLLNITSLIVKSIAHLGLFVALVVISFASNVEMDAQNRGQNNSRCQNDIFQQSCYVGNIKVSGHVVYGDVNYKPDQNATLNIILYIGDPANGGQQLTNFQVQSNSNYGCPNQRSGTDTFCYQLPRNLAGTRNEINAYNLVTAGGNSQQLFLDDARFSLTDQSYDNSYYRYNGYFTGGAVTYAFIDESERLVIEGQVQTYQNRSITIEFYLNGLPGQGQRIATVSTLRGTTNNSGSSGGGLFSDSGGGNNSRVPGSFQRTFSKNQLRSNQGSLYVIARDINGERTQLANSPIQFYVANWDFGDNYNNGRNTGGSLFN